MSNIQAIIRKSSTIAVTFSGKPDADIIQTLKHAGFKYDNGNWFKNQSDSQLIGEADVVSHVEA